MIFNQNISSEGVRKSVSGLKMQLDDIFKQEVTKTSAAGWRNYMYKWHTRHDSHCYEFILIRYTFSLNSDCYPDHSVFTMWVSTVHTHTNTEHWDTERPGPLKLSGHVALLGPQYVLKFFPNDYTPARHTHTQTVFVEQLENCSSWVNEILDVCKSPGATCIKPSYIHVWESTSYFQA